jgi:uncharacterized SAM-binding protein YcdF (DUF218 family)
MIEISSKRPSDSSGPTQSVATNAFLGVLASLLLAQLAPWGDADPLGTIISLIVGAVGGVTIGMYFRRGLLLALDAGLLAVYLVVALTPIMEPITRSWVRIDALPADTLDAVIALSAGVKSDSALNTVAADRLISALELMRAGRARRLLTTRQIEHAGSRVISSDVDQRRLISLASLSSMWTVVDSVHTTHDEAVRTAMLLLPVQHNIIVMTSPMHTRRACALFEAAGFRVYCQASRERDYATNPPLGYADRLAALRTYGYERLAMIKSRLKGWLKPGRSNS